MPYELKLTVRCNRCGSEATSTEHDGGDFWKFIEDMRERGWILRSAIRGESGESVICENCWTAEHGPRIQSRYRCSPDPVDNQTENVYTMSLRRCGQIARALGFELYVVQNLSADDDGGVWGVMVRTDGGDYSASFLNTLVEHFPHWPNVTLKVQSVLADAADEIGGGHVTYDDPNDSDARNIIVFPYGTEVPPKG